MTTHASEYKPCSRCGKKRVHHTARRNYCRDCRTDGLRPIANWMEHGACRNEAYDPDWWWPEQSDPTAGSTPVALAICQHCKVRDLCLDYALKHEERYGIWGGLMASARLSLIGEAKRRKRVS